MSSWEYVMVQCFGHNKPLGAAENILVTSSDGRFQQSKMRNDFMSIVSIYGDDGWELVQIEGDTVSGFYKNFYFKRPK